MLFFSFLIKEARKSPLILFWTALPACNGFSKLAMTDFRLVVPHFHTLLFVGHDQHLNIALFRLEGKVAECDLRDIYLS